MSSIDSRLATRDREFVGSNLREPTTLEQCVDSQRRNADYIDNISSRINHLISKLRGNSPKASGDCDGALRESEGLLGDHKEALEYEGVRLGAIQADLAVLESLL